MRKDLRMLGNKKTGIGGRFQYTGDEVARHGKRYRSFRNNASVWGWMVSGLVISRSAHDADNPFTQIANSAIRNRTLSLDTRGLLALMLSHSDGYVVNEETLRAEGAGRSQARRMIREMEAAGYLSRTPRQKDKAGKWTAAQWELAEEPTAQKRTPVKRTSEKPTAGEPTSGNDPSLRITILEEEQEKQEEQAEEEQRALGDPAPDVPLNAFVAYERLFEKPTEGWCNELVSLIGDYGDPEVAIAIEIMHLREKNTPQYLKGILQGRVDSGEVGQPAQPAQQNRKKPKSALDAAFFDNPAEPKNDLRLHESDSGTIPGDGPQFIPPPDVDEEIAPAGIEVVEPPAVRWLDRDPVEPKNDFRVVHEARWPRTATALKAVGD